MPPRAVLTVLLAAVLVAVLGGCGHRDPGAPADRTLVATASGPVRGIAGDGFRLFQGVPYAAAPTGSLRWQPPVAPVPWRLVRDATKPGLRCVQDVAADPDYGLTAGEDCLNLTVWAPDTPARPATAATRRPVLVWIHGGGFLNGSSDIYNARWLATRGDMVVVTVNYRLGALGFLAHPALTGRGGPGNYGLADQQQALRWVRDNITGFGGDPQRVTIAGESAGAMSVCDHLVAPESSGLFRAAIMQSGPCQAQAALPAAERISMDFAAAAGCPKAAAARACLEALPPSRLEGGPTYFRIGDIPITGPVTGTQRLPLPVPGAARLAGRIARVPVLIGSTADEFNVFVALSYLRTKKLAPYPELLAKAFGPRAAAVAEHYPLSRYDGSAGLAYAAAVTDAMFSCPIDELAGELARRAPVYAYEFNDRHAPAPEPLLRSPVPPAAGHALELRYLFEMGGAPPLTPAQQRLSEQMVDYWSRFVATGTPEADGGPAWPQLNDEEPQRISFQTPKPVLTDDFAARHQCEFWNG